MSVSIPTIGRDMMKYCNTCHVKFEPPVNQCIFCNNTLELVHSEQTSNEDWNYPVYQKIHHSRKIFLKLLTFLVVVANFVCILINQFTTGGKLTWSLYVIVATSYSLLFFTSISLRGRLIKKVVQVVLLTDALLLCIGVIAGSYHWCIDYVLPISVNTLNLYAVFHLIGRRQRMYDYSVYVLNLSVLGIAFGILLYTKLIDTPWAIITCMISSVVILLALFLFSPKAIWEELLRRLHF